jgi:hypothetical protein
MVTSDTFRLGTLPHFTLDLPADRLLQDWLVMAGGKLQAPSVEFDKMEL